jgi:hypothetical protein
MGAESELGVEAEGAESEGENQRGRCAGGGLLPPTPLTTGRIYRPSFREKGFFRENCVFKFGHGTVTCNHKIFD